MNMKNTEQAGEVQGDVVSSIAEFLKERDESLAPGEATDSERVVSARIIASLHVDSSQVSGRQCASFESWAKESASLDLSTRHGKYLNANTFCASLAWQAALASRQPEGAQAVEGKIKALRDRIEWEFRTVRSPGYGRVLHDDLRMILALIDGRDAGAGVGS